MSRSHARKTIFPGIIFNLIWFDSRLPYLADSVARTDPVRRLFIWKKNLIIRSVSITEMIFFILIFFSFQVSAKSELWYCFSGSEEAAVCITKVLLNFQDVCQIWDRVTKHSKHAHRRREIKSRWERELPKEFRFWAPDLIMSHWQMTKLQRPIKLEFKA